MAILLPTADSLEKLEYLGKMRDKERRTAKEQIIQNDYKYEQYIEAACKQRREITILSVETAMKRMTEIYEAMIAVIRSEHDQQIRKSQLETRKIAERNYRLRLVNSKMLELLHQINTDGVGVGTVTPSTIPFDGIESPINGETKEESIGTAPSSESNTMQSIIESDEQINDSTSFKSGLSTPRSNLNVISPVVEGIGSPRHNLRSRESKRRRMNEPHSSADDDYKSEEEGGADGDDRNIDDLFTFSIDCKECGDHFDDINEYQNHLEQHFDDDPEREWRICKEDGCDSTKKWRHSRDFIRHLSGKHEYGRPYRCICAKNGNQCTVTATQKSHIKEHIERIHQKDPC